MSALFNSRRSNPLLLSAAIFPPTPLNTRGLLLLLLLLASFSPQLRAQTASGSLRGVVADQTGAVVAGARVSVRRAASVPVRETTSDERGNFVIGELPSGTYTLVVERQGFRPSEQTVSVGAVAQSLLLTLAPAPVSESVTVSEADAAVETTLRLPTTPRETPRSLTVIGSERIREQSFRQVPDVLAYANMTTNSFRTGGYHFYSRGYRMGPDDTRVDGFAGLNTGGGFGASLFVVVLSSVVISYTWAGNLVYRVVGETPPAPRTPPSQVPGGQSDRPPELALDGLDALLSRSEQQVAGWRSISLQLPTKRDAPVTFTIDRGNGGQPQKRAQLTLDRATGEVVRWEPFSSYTPGRRLRSYLRFAHTGEVLGLFGQTVAGLASLGGAVLVYTGLSLAWRRLRAWMERRAHTASSLSAPTDAEILSGSSAD